MTCPHCGGDTKVIDSRPQVDSVHRRRECLTCKERFSTAEIDLQMYDKLVSEFLDTIQEKVNETMERIKNDVNTTILKEVFKRENGNNQN